MKSLSCANRECSLAGNATADVLGDLLVDDSPFGMEEDHLRVRPLGWAGHLRRSANAFGGLATLDGGRTSRLVNEKMRGGMARRALSINVCCSYDQRLR
jgi:hypothetical protein